MAEIGEPTKGDVRLVRDWELAREQIFLLDRPMLPPVKCQMWNGSEWADVSLPSSPALSCKPLKHKS